MVIANPFFESGPREPSHAERVVVSAHRFRRPAPGPTPFADRLAFARRLRLGLVFPALVAAGSIYGVVTTQGNGHHSVPRAPSAHSIHRP
ncbi:MAG TPA: hypothetical protein VFH70_02685 [Acidimicrobiales bacterium]|nr:hypothetical protein [Acidimicrobiales bacterium]